MEAVNVLLSPLSPKKTGLECLEEGTALMKTLHLGHLHQGDKHGFLRPFKYRALAGL